MTKQNQFSIDQMIRTKKNKNQFLPKAIKHKRKPNWGFRETTRHSRLREGQLEVGWSKRHSKQGQGLCKNRGQRWCRRGTRSLQCKYILGPGEVQRSIRGIGMCWSRDKELWHKNCKRDSMKSLLRFVLGWVKKQRSIKEVIKHNGQRNHQGNTPIPRMVTNLLCRIYDYKQNYLP